MELLSEIEVGVIYLKKLSYLLSCQGLDEEIDVSLKNVCLVNMTLHPALD